MAEKTNTQYKQELRQLRKYYNFSFDARNTLTPARKAAITRAKNRFNESIGPALAKGGQFKKAGKGKRQKVKALAGTGATTPKGYVLAPPTGARSIQYDAKKGAIVSRVGEFVFVQYALTDPVAFAENPDKVLRALPDYKKARFVRVNVGPGHHTGNQAFTPDQMNRYITADLPNAYPSRGNKNPSEFITGVTLVFLDERRKNNGNKNKTVRGNRRRN